MTSTTASLPSRTFKIREVCRANEEFGGSDGVRTETLTLLPSGEIRTVGRWVGVHEGERQDQRWDRLSGPECRGPEGFERACLYRLTHGYGEVMTPTLTWASYPGSEIQAPLHCAGAYVISERWCAGIDWDDAAQAPVETRTGQFTLSYRPEGAHVPMGTFQTLDEAQRAAEADARERAAR